MKARNSISAVGKGPRRGELTTSIVFEAACRSARMENGAYPVNL